VTTFKLSNTGNQFGAILPAGFLMTASIGDLESMQGRHHDEVDIDLSHPGRAVIRIPKNAVKNSSLKEFGRSLDFALGTITN